MTLTSSDALPTSLGAAIRAHRLALITSAAFSVIAAACSLAPFIAVYAVTVALFIEDDASSIPLIVGFAAAALLLRSIANAISTHVGHVAAYRILKGLRLAIGRKLNRLPLGRVQARSSGEMKKILHDDVEQLEEALAHGIPDGAAAAAVPIVTIVALFVLDWRLALLALGALVLLVVVSAIGMVLAQKNNKALAEHALVLNRAVMGYLHGIRVIRAYLRADSGYDRAKSAVIRGAQLQDAATSGPLRWLVAGMSAATGLAVVLLIPGAGLGYVNGDVDLATLVLFLVLSLGFLAPIMTLVGTLATIMTRIQLSATAVQEILAEEELTESPNPRLPERFDVEFDEVSFGYHEHQRTVDAVSLRVPEGASLALVGETGSGKSTLARLLARFYDTGEGAVRIGGIDVREIASTDLARIVAFIQQDEYVFEESLLENIRIARPTATDEEVVRAALHAQLDDVADGLTNGWHTALSAGGGELSGGQRQRIAVARALLKDAPVIVLDEATASLDATTERRTLDAIAQLTRTRTVIAIAHRLATITDSDSIAVIDAGRIAAQGTHRELLARHEPYRALWDAYTSSEGWRIEPVSGPTEKAHTPDSEAAELSILKAPITTATSESVPIAAATLGSATVTTATSPQSAATDPEPWVAIERQNVGRMGFFAQWRTLYGRGWQPLMRRGLVRLILESLVRGAPLLAVLVVVVVAVGAGGADALTAGSVWLVTGALLLALLARVFASAWTNQLVWQLAAQSKSDLQLSILDRLRRVPLGFFQHFDAGRAGATVTSDIPMLDFQNIPQQVAGSLVQPLYASIILLIVDWRLALAALVGLPLFWAITVWSDRIYHRVFADLHEARGRATAIMLQQARGAAVIRGNPDSKLVRRYDAAMTGLADASIAMSVKATPAAALGAVVVELGQVLLIAVGAALFSAGAVGAPTLLVFLFLSLTIYQPIQELGALTGYRRNQQQIAAKIGEVWDAETLVEPPQPAAMNGTAIDFQNVTFGYSEDATLRGVTLRAETGQVTALVGRSGAGKSTIASLIARLWDVDSGSITIGGADLRALGTAKVTANVTTVFQEVYLFDDTVRANLTLARPEATDAEIWRALDSAQCTDVVAALPKGLDTVLTEGGSDLSGGQRQRLSIARALLKDSPIVILDEAVAAVDPGTEDRIQAALSSLMSNRTVIVIAHRLSTITNADRIVVVDRGTVVGSGTHDELLQTCTEYFALAEAQGLAPDSTTVATFSGKEPGKS
ncbi:MAG: ABC transporter ATP-binding protein [Gulosibacter sp.]|uniref:ABC transporter ATP-binding protein n=1 Tax=Gulosibacter sp. TaxID=2817531 RepID=UPI003F909718